MQSVVRRTLASTSKAAQAQVQTAADAEKKFFLVTLNRSPLHLPKKVKATCQTIGLTKRLATAIVPVTQQTTGHITSIKELVSVRVIGEPELASIANYEWASRPGNGRRGSGMQTGPADNAVIRVGTERARGDERGYRVI